MMNSMVFLFVSCCFMSSIYAQQQYTDIKVLPSQLRFSFENVQMTTEPDIAFLGTGVEFIGISRRLVHWSVGLNSYSAVRGIRPGLITLGLSTGLHLPLIKKYNISLNTGAFLGGGGGGDAADGGGLIIRSHVGFEKHWGRFLFSTGLSYLDFPTGAIKGTQLYTSIAIDFETYLKKQDSLSKEYPILTKLKGMPIDFGLATTYYYNYTNDSVFTIDENFQEKDIGAITKTLLIGAQLSYYIKQNTYALFKINGAFLGENDGYMSILFGIGKRAILFKNRLYLHLDAVAGPSGGGGISSGGGFISQYEGGISYYFKNHFYLKTMLGYTHAPWGNLSNQHFEVTLGRSLEGIRFLREQSHTSFSVPKDTLSEYRIQFSGFNRTYINTNKSGDLRAIDLAPTFNLIGFEGGYYLNKHFSVNAATVWAYQGDHGAYAEGLLGAAYYQNLYDKLKVNMKVLIGATGGGSLDVGGGFVSQLSLGTHFKFSESINLIVNTGKYIALQGTFNPYFVDVGFGVNFTKLFFK